MKWELDGNLMQQLNLAAPMDYFELAKELSKNWDQRATPIQNNVRKIIKSNADFKDLKRNRTLRKNAPFLSEYVKTNKFFNDLAIRYAQGDSLDKTETRKVLGLCDEIYKSNTTVQGGTWLYYGLGVYGGSRQVSVCHFLSLTFCPVVAATHAFRKAAVWQSPTDCQFPHKPTVLAVQLTQNTKGLFGNEHEFEIIFPQGLSLDVMEHYSDPTATFDTLLCRL